MIPNSQPDQLFSRLLSGCSRGGREAHPVHPQQTHSELSRLLPPPGRAHAPHHVLTLSSTPPPAAALTTSCCVLSMLLPLHVDCHCPSPCVFQALLATTIRYPHKLLSRLWMAFRLAWNAWRSSWSAPKTTANLTDPNPRGSLLLF